MYKRKTNNKKKKKINLKNQARRDTFIFYIINLYFRNL